MLSLTPKKLALALTVLCLLIGIGSSIDLDSVSHKKFHSNLPDTELSQISIDLVEPNDLPKIQVLITKKPENSDESSNSFVSASAKRPFDFAKSITLGLSRFESWPSEATLTLILDQKLHSNPVRITEVLNNTINFHFQKLLEPGKYYASFKVSNGPIDISVQGQKDVSGNYWLNSTSGPWLPNYSDFLASLVETGPLPLLTYTFLVVGLLLSALTIDSTRIFTGLILFILTSSVLSLTTPMSGHDETAHLDMMFRSQNSSEHDSNAFNEKAYRYLNQNDFYYLHRVHPVAAACPHEILGGCGITSWPSSYYSRVTRIFSQIGFEATDSLISLTIRFQLYFVLLTFIVFTVLVASGHDLALVTLVSVVFSGSFWSALPSITNDTLLFLFGIVSSVTVVAGLRKDKVFTYTFSTILIALLGWGYFIDKSWIFAPLGLAAPASFCLGRKTPPKSSSASELREYLLHGRGFLGILVILVLGPVALLWLLDQTLDIVNGRSITLFNKLSSGYLSQAQGVWKTFTLNQYAEFLLAHFKSFYGTFVWGHSYFSNKLYLVLTILSVYLGFEAWCWIQKNLTRISRLLFLTYMLLGIWFGICALYIVSNKHFGSPEIVFESYTKIRLIAPLLGFYLFPMTIGAFAISKNRFKQNFIKIGCLCYLAILLTYYLPKFYFYDKFW